MVCAGTQRIARLTLVLGTLAIGAGRHAGATDVNGFLEAAGHGTFALSFTAESYDEFWAGTTKVSDPGLGRVRTNSTSLYAQHGITDRVSLVANLPYVNTRGDGQAGFSESGLQDISALLKVRVARSGTRAQSTIVLAGGLRTIASNYEANKPVDIGDGTADGLLRAVYLLRAGRFYWSQQVGLDIRGGEAPNGFPVYSEVGCTLGRTTTSLLYNGYWADGGTDIGDPGFTFPSNQDETQRLGAKAYVRLSESWGVAGHLFTALSGRNSGDATGYGAALVVRY